MYGKSPLKIVVLVDNDRNYSTEIESQNSILDSH